MDQQEVIPIKLPTDDRRLSSKQVFLDDIAMTFGGYVAEELVFGRLQLARLATLSKATSMARAMVVRYGMSDVVGANLLLKVREIK